MGIVSGLTNNPINFFECNILGLLVKISMNLIQQKNALSIIVVVSDNDF